MVKIPNTNLLLGVGGIIAAVFLVSQIRKAGGDLQNALSGIELPSIGDISFPEIKFPEFKLPDITFPEFNLGDITFPEFPKFDFPEFPDVTKGFEDIQNQFGEFTKGITEQLDAFGKTFVDPERIDQPFGDTGQIIDVVPDFGGRGAARGAAAEVFGPTEILTPEGDILDPNRPLTIAELGKTSLVDSIKKIITPEISPIPIVSELPIQQPFQGGGVGFIGGTIRENPIDTLSEAIGLGLTASQAADFLAATGGKILPSQIESGLIDPDIRNIVGGIIGQGKIQSIPVSSTPLETLSIRESENIKAAEFTCKEFGLNCELVDGMMA